MSTGLGEVFSFILEQSFYYPIKKTKGIFLKVDVTV